MEWLWLHPGRLFLVSCVFNYDAHTVTAIVIRKITHDPHTRMIHLDDGRNPFRRSEPENRHFSGCRYRIPVQCYDLEEMSRQRQAANLSCTGIQNVKQH